ncbi:MAG TPA: macro domain-containing protein [Candidatus Angelobacter sp.]|nr:macro domain-containing protein [Candidatus Angelobacter sp.]
MIRLCRGDILHANAEALVNTVNCVGVMGRGIALQFRKAFPENYSAYKAACEKHQVQPGKMLVFDLNRLENPRFIINFPTKRHWKGKSNISDIKSGLKSLADEIRCRQIESVAIPPLGCGLGGLDWQEVRPLIEQAFADVPNVRAFIYEPSGAPAPEEMVKQKKAPKLTVGRAALLGLMRRYLSAVMDPSVSLLEIHKFMYFMQEAGEPLRLNFRKGIYGPYAENLRHVLTQLEGHFITGYGDAQDSPEKQIELKPNAAQEAEEFLDLHLGTRQRFDRVSDLINGFETPFGMELLATVQWVAREEGASTEADAISKTHAWNTRKRKFSKEHIGVAWQVLHDKRWLH